MNNIHCMVCKKVLTREEVCKTVPLGHGQTYIFWHKDKECQGRVDGIPNRGDRSEYEDIKYSDDDEIREKKIINSQMKTLDNFFFGGSRRS